MHLCRLSFHQLEKYLKILTGNGLLICEDAQGRIQGKWNHVRYFTTELGKVYLHHYNRMVQTLNPPFQLDSSSR